MPDTGLNEAEVRQRLREVEQQLAVVRGRTHEQNNRAQIEAMLGKKGTDLPLWLKIVGAAAALLIPLSMIITGLVAYGRSDAATLARIVALETWKVDTATVPNRLQALETNMDMARRVRDQQQQGMSDRLVGLERSDKDDRDALNRVLQTLATITAQLQSQGGRVEELLRRQDRLENRLGARPGSNEPEQPTALRMVPLVWRPIVN